MQILAAIFRGNAAEKRTRRLDQVKFERAMFTNARQRCHIATQTCQEAIRIRGQLELFQPSDLLLYLALGPGRLWNDQVIIPEQFRRRISTLRFCRTPT